MKLHIASNRSLRQIEPVETCLILGASRGLGRELAKTILSAGHSVIGVSRKEHLLRGLQSENSAFTFFTADFTKAVDQDRVLEEIRSRKIDRVFYVAGGGPFGPFHESKWPAHEWAWAVTFTFAARVLHQLASQPLPPQTILIGSSVAESEPDPGAASYGAAKHALKGLFLSLSAEYPNWDLRLFSPGYMDTEMIPKNAAVRNKGLHSPVDVARDLWRWTLTDAPGGHMMAPKHP